MQALSRFIHFPIRRWIGRRLGQVFAFRSPHPPFPVFLLIFSFQETPLSPSLPQPPPHWPWKNGIFSIFHFILWIAIACVWFACVSTVLICSDWEEFVMVVLCVWCCMDVGNRIVQSFQLDKVYGKKCYMLSARTLFIVWGDTPRFWRWISHPDVR